MLAIRILLLIFVALAAACTKPAVWAPDEEVIAARYVHGNPASITYFNVINNDTGTGEHAALMINASERVLFDPAGTWQHPQSPEQHDVHFGFDDRQLHRYIYYHARRTHHVRKHYLELPPEHAELILRLARQAGPVSDGFCARSIGEILRQIPGLEHMPVAFQPNRLSDAFARLPGVREERIYSDAEPTERQSYFEG
ncbi:MAG: hypothetical protein JJT95_01855 [Pararhodobacter sp.]|nr:hypothetical protein [Pararhodobacter sp.]